MLVGVCRLHLVVLESFSLKDKRQVVKSIIGRVGSRYNVSIAEVGLNDSRTHAVIGFSTVSNDAVHVEDVLSKVANFIENDGRVEVIDVLKEQFSIMQREGLSEFRGR